MAFILDFCSELDVVSVDAGETLIAEGKQSNRLVILKSGAVEVFRGDVTIVIVDEPGAIFGEMSVLLDLPHTANVRTLAPSEFHIIENASDYVRENPVILYPIARLLAHRLKNTTDYLVDIKRQYSDREDHLGMVDEVLDSLVNQQTEEFISKQVLPPDP